MSYERKIWVNNQTKLNATNMNHIEEGIESVSADSASALELAQSVSAKIDSLSVSVTDIAQKTADAGNLAADAKSLADGAVSQIKDVSAVAGEAKAVAEEAKAVADEAAEKIGEKQDILVSGTNIKSLNGESILGAGDIKVATNMPFSQLAKADLNALSEQGVYKIETAANYPIGTSPSGTLHVNKLGDAHYEQL